MTLRFPEAGSSHPGQAAAASPSPTAHPPHLAASSFYLPAAWGTAPSTANWTDGKGKLEEREDRETRAAWEIRKPARDRTGAAS